jgi:hypothetical protein
LRIGGGRWRRNVNIRRKIKRLMKKRINEEGTVFSVLN